MKYYMKSEDIYFEIKYFLENLKNNHSKKTFFSPEYIGYSLSSFKI